ncbi:MAG TPA: twin-arginine translocase TatA/TatE family subunit [Anaerolineales bacterium]|nr:twin-arginine translocase TatA/TatE family subunit [Anaerolineales bacterium]
MEFLGIGASELIFILIIAIIVLGPKDMQKAGRTVGRWLNQFVRSDGWRALQRASQEIKRLPTNLMREANLDADELREMDREIRRNIDPRQPSSPARSGVRRNPATGQPIPPKTESSSEPPAVPPADAPIRKEQDE